MAQALNTVLAFCSSRKSLAITFSVVRKSVENLLKRYEFPFVIGAGTDLCSNRPLELDQVAELK